MGNEVSFLRKQHYVWVQGCRSGGDTPLPPMWPGFDIRCGIMLVEFVGSLLYTERFFPGVVWFSPLLKNQYLI